MASNLVGKAWNYRWIIFWILASCYILVHFHRLCPAVLATDIMRDLEAGGTFAGFMAAAYFYPYAAMQLPAGLLSDSWGPRNTITFFSFIAFFGSLIMSMAPSVFWAITGRTLVGLGIAMLFVPTMKILAEWFDVKDFAFVTGILMAIGGLGSFLATTPLVWLSSWIGWRFSFLVVGIFTLILAVLVWTFVRDRPSDFGWPSPSGLESSENPISFAKGIGIILGCSRFWPMAILFFVNGGIFFSFGGIWGGPYLVQVYGLTKAQSGEILSMLAVGLILGSLFPSYLSSTIFRARKPIIVISSTVLFCITAVLAFHTDAIPLTALYLTYFGLGVFSGAIVVIGFASTKELFPIQIAGTATGLINLFPFVGGAIFQPLLGYCLEQHGYVDYAFTLAGYQHAFLILFLSGAVALIVSLFIKETVPPNNGIIISQ
uniref:Lysosomal dipeptide transporter MFSD1 n=1 Tax=Candidatus Kentrum sp. MB TaxID=2138164 RepID=A0A450XVM5_9GAMM|nr:MAG: Sugar phosphate permease [Candidatus Kentron sp. MB]